MKLDKDNSMNHTVRPRIRQSEKKKPVYRVPWHVCEIAYQEFNTKANRAKLSDGVAVWASRLIREEHFTVEELRELRQIMTDQEADTTEISREILGGEETLHWLEAVLSGRVTAGSELGD